MRTKNEKKDYRNWLAISDETYVCTFSHVITEKVACKRINDCLGPQDKIIALDVGTARNLVEKGTDRIYIG